MTFNHSDGTRHWTWRHLPVVVLAFCAASAPAASTSTSTFVYVSIFEPVSGVAPFNATSGALVLLSPVVPGIVEAGGVAVSADGTSVYVAGGDVVSQYTAAPDGTLVAKSPPTVASGAGTNRIVVSPDGSSVYVANGLDGTVSQYDALPDGTLTAKSLPAVAAGSFPDGIAISPDGSSVYVTNRNDNTVSQYDVGPDGLLAPKRPAAIASATPVSIAVSPDGASVYVANIGANTVSQYDVAAGGVLSPKIPATVAAGGMPIDLVVSHQGRSVYVSNGNGTISQYDVDPTLGTLSPKMRAQVPADCVSDVCLGGLVVTPDDASVYVAGANQGVIFQYDIDRGTGSLFPKNPSWVPAQGNPAYLAVTSRPAIPSAVTFSPVSLSFLKQKVGTISASQTVTVTNTGGLTLTIGGVDLAGPDSDEFGVSGESCSGAQLAPSASCAISVRFAPVARGPATAAVKVTSDATGTNEVRLQGTTKPPK